ncbi:MAG TPA: hypothetical protein VF530_02120 [Planctomycetota bacterium]
MPLFPGQYDLLFVPRSLSNYLALTDAQRMTVKQYVAQQIKSTIDLAQLQGWTFSLFKVLADSSGHKPESEVQQDLENLVSGLGQGGNRLSIRSDGTTYPDEPTTLGYDKQFDCGISCHHVYGLHIDDGSGVFRPWTISHPSHPGVVFELRASLMWLSASGVTGASATPAPSARTTLTEARKATGTKAFDLPAVPPPRARRAPAAPAKGRKRARS